MDLNGLACCELRKKKGEQINEKKYFVQRYIFMETHL